MATTKQEIDSFARFAKDRLAEGDMERSIDELFDLWRIENPSPEQFEQDILAVKASLRDLENGD